MVVRIAGKHMYLWRAIDHEGEVLEILVQRRRDRSAAVKLMRKLLRKQGFAPPTSCAPTALPSAISDFPATMSRACEQTIGRRIRIKWCAGASARCNASNQPHRRNAF